jgi:hypothetical protein
VVFGILDMPAVGCNSDAFLNEAEFHYIAFEVDMSKMGNGSDTAESIAADFDLE